jgi:dipeptide transport system substrate-binding protein
VPAKNPLPPTMSAYNDAVKDDGYDPEGAKKLLAQAGLANGFTTDLWAMPVQRPYNPNAKRIAELMQADLAKIGVKAEIKTFEWGEYRKRMQAGEHQMGMLGWTGDNGDPDNFLAVLLGCDAAKTNGSNVAKFCHQPFEDLIQKAKTITKPADRDALYKRRR